MSADIVLTNAQIVAADEVIKGTLIVRDGLISEIERGKSSIPGAVDLEGRHLLPGLVEVHTDNLEKHLRPRPGVKWPVAASVSAHDAQIIGAGITTVCDALSVGDAQRKGFRSQILHDAVAAITHAEQAGENRAEHHLHMRCEISDGDMVDLFSPHVENRLLRLVSIMDHTPGQRQYSDVSKFREANRVKLSLSDAQLDELVGSRLEDQSLYAAKNRAWLLERIGPRRIPLATHDDTTPKDIEEAVAAGSRISEFPTTLAAAISARACGMKIVMGAPNIVLGGSHSGNASAAELAERGLLDIISSDYVPASLLQSLWILHRLAGLPLPHAVALGTAHPARALNLGDRGKIEPGRRADLLCVSVGRAGPIVRAVWRRGLRVA